MNTKTVEKWELTPEKFLNQTETAKLLQRGDELWVLGTTGKRKALVRDAFLIQTAIYTGIRNSEICCLKVAEMHVKAGESHIVISEEGAKGSKPRIVHIGTEYKAIAKRFLAWKQEQGETDADEYLLRTERARHYTPSALWRRWRRYSTKTLHAARHTNATLLYQATKNLRAVQKQLGHSRITTTQIYADVPAEEMKASMVAMERLARSLKKNPRQNVAPAADESGSSPEIP